MSIASCGAGHDNAATRVLFSPREVEAILGVSHATVYRLINAGRLDARKIDAKTVVTAASLSAFIAGLPKAGEAAA
jgi:predicted DNA-binding transcriptional regulator AlpA